jgi:hypothetical protein
MKKPRIEFTVVKEDRGYSAYAHVGNDSIFTEGEDFSELKKNLTDATNTAFYDKGFKFKYDEFKISFDLESFFGFYRVINASALSKRINMNRSLLTQYISGKKKPSRRQTEKILNGVHEIGRELSEIELTYP